MTAPMYEKNNTKSDPISLPGTRWQWADAVWAAAKRHRISGTPLALMLYLCRYIRWSPDDEGYGEAKIRSQQICSNLSITPKTLRAAQGVLANQNLLRIHRGKRGTPTTFRLNLSPQSLPPRGKNPLLRGKNSPQSPPPVLIVENIRNTKGSGPASFFQEKGHKDISLEIMDRWNDLATKKGLAKIIEITGKRRAAIKVRGEKILAVWEEVEREVSASPFLCGKNDRGWRISFDTLIGREDMLLKIIEGNYRQASGEVYASRAYKNNNGPWLEKMNLCESWLDYDNLAKEMSKQRHAPALISTVLALRDEEYSMACS